MLSLCLPSLFDVCGIRFAYLMWCRHDVTKRLSKEWLFNELVDIVMADVLSFPLPENVRSRILKHVKPTGKHLLSVLNLWHSKLPPESPLTADMIFECLMLNANGMINQRKTAEKLLSSRMVNNVLAFRLASINFLEKEVLRLWPSVSLFFLNKIILESDQPCSGREASETLSSNLVLSIEWKLGRILHDLDFKLEESYSPSFQCSFEPYEVLFWISYCLEKEIAANLSHFTGKIRVGDEFSLEDPTLYDNVSYFDYIRNCNNKRNQYDPVKMIKNIFDLKEKDRQQSCFIFHFMQLNSEETADLFQRYALAMVSQFLKWPLTLTFVERAEELWNLIPDIDKPYVLLNLVAVLFPRYCITYDYSFDGFTGMYDVENAKSVWAALWKISLESYKSQVFSKFVDRSVYGCVIPTPLSTGIYVTSGLRDKLREIFLQNGETLFELYAEGNLTESLGKFVSKHMPEQFEDLSRICILFDEPEPEIFFSEKSVFPDDRRSVPNRPTPVDKNFVLCVKDLLFTSNSIDKAFFYK